eukprot:scaffold8264_cov109-Isochrysis_galbana.AAC.7
MGDPALYPEIRTARFLYAMQWLPPDLRADYQARQQTTVDRQQHVLHTKAACMLEVILGPSGSHVVFVLIEVPLEKHGVEVRKVVVDPLLAVAVLGIVAKVARQEERRVLVAQSADLRVLAGVTHRTARRWQLSAYS